jgi:hypothetical protein
MQKVLVDFGSDTVANLDSISAVKEIARNELVRRGAEVTIVLSNSSDKAIAGVLKEQLFSVRKVLSERSPFMVELGKTMDRAASLASALSAIVVVKNGRVASDAISVYATSMTQHLSVISSGETLQRKQLDAIKADVDAFINLVEKLYDRRERLTTPQH